MVRCGIVERYHIIQLTKKQINSGLYPDKDIKYNINDLCNYVGISRQSYNYIINNKRQASLEVALKIYDYLFEIGFDFLNFEDIFYIEND